MPCFYPHLIFFPIILLRKLLLKGRNSSTKVFMSYLSMKNRYKLMAFTN